MAMKVVCHLGDIKIAETGHYWKENTLQQLQCSSMIDDPNLDSM